jgi:proton-translocating NADH-quinone oxidoreductase chain N
MEQFLLLWLITLLLSAAPLTYLAGRLWIVSATWRVTYPAVLRPRSPIANLPARGLALAALAAAWAPLLLALRGIGAVGVARVSIGAVGLRQDGLSILVAVLALTVGVAVILFSGPDIAGAAGEEKYYAIVLVSVGALIGLACAGDLFNLWIWFELLAVASYVLVSYRHDDGLVLEAGVKCLAQGAAGSALVLLGIALVLAQTGTLDLDAIRAQSRQSPILLVAGGLMIVGFGVKTAIVPLHTWLPDAYTRAPSGISAFLSAIVTKAGLVALVRVLGGLTDQATVWGGLLMGSGVLNILAGTLLALRQTQVKRLLAYSSLAHIGYILLGLGIGVYAGQPAAIQGGLFHLISHGLMTALAFLAVGALLNGLTGTAPEQGSFTIEDLSGAAGRYPFSAFMAGLAALGLAGLPPLAGFMSKWQIFVGGFSTRNPLISGLVVLAVLASVVSLAYYARLVNTLYRKNPSSAVRRGRRLPLGLCVPLAPLAFLAVALGVWPGLAAWLTEPAGAAVLAAFRP